MPARPPTDARPTDARSTDARPTEAAPARLPRCAVAAPGRARRRRALLSTALAVWPALLSACGGDDAPSSASTDRSLAAFCDAELAQDRAFQQLDADAPGFAEALESTQQLVDAAVAAAPAEIADAVGVRAAAFAEVRATGDPERFFTEPVTAAADRVHDVAVQRCDWRQIEVGAVDYAYRAEFPTEPGTVSFELSGEGAEPHVLLVARHNDSVDGADAVDGAAIDAFRAAPDEAALLASFEVVASAFVAPGERATALAELRPGSYVVYCPIPVGSTMDGAGGGGQPEGPPHFTAGMLSSFTVAS